MAKQYFGKYRGIVKDNRRNNVYGQIDVSVPSIFPAEEVVHATPALPFGYFFVPETGANVWVEFEGGNPDLPLWTGLVYTDDQYAAEAKVDPPQSRVIKTAAGHLVVFNDKDGEASIQVKDGANGHEILLNGDGIQVTDGVNSGQVITLDSAGVSITDKNTNEVVLDSSGVSVTDANQNKVTLAASGITVETAAGAKITITAAMLTVECPGAVQIKGNPIMLSSSAALPVLRLTDQGIGNLGAPVPMVIGPGNLTVLA